MNLFPLFHRLQDCPVLLVGGGDAALAKYRLLSSAGAKISVVAPHLTQDFHPLLQSSPLYFARDFEEADLEGKQLVFVASGKASLDHKIAQLAMQKNIRVNVVDRPEYGDLVMPSIVDRDSLIVAISTDGASPVLAQRVRAMIEELLPAHMGRLVEFARRFRSAIAARFSDLRARRLFWNHIFDGEIAAWVLNGKEEKAHRALIRELNSPQNSLAKKEREEGLIEIQVAMPDDLTLRQMRQMRQADAVLLDKDIGPEFMHFFRREVSLKICGDGDDEIWMTEHLRLGQSVVHLKHWAIQGKRESRL